MTTMDNEAGVPGEIAPPQQSLIASPWHTLLVVGFVALNAYRAVLNAAQARIGLGAVRPRIYLRTILFECLMLGIVVLGVRLRGVSLQTVFGRRWSSARQFVRDLGLGIILLVGSTLFVSIVGGHQQGAAQDQAIAFLIPRTSFEMLLWFVLSAVAGICEEAVYRGYFQAQFGALTHSVTAGIVCSAVAFGVVHSYQGWQRAIVIGLSALLFGAFAHWRRTVRPGMFAHSLQDALAPFLLKLVHH